MCTSLLRTLIWYSDGSIIVVNKKKSIKTFYAVNCTEHFNEFQLIITAKKFEYFLHVCSVVNDH